TGVLHTQFKINQLLSGILVMTALYSINLHVMGKSNVPLMSQRTLLHDAEKFGATLLPQTAHLNFIGWEVGVPEAAGLIAALMLASFTGLILYLFFRTELGTSMRATGDNPQMIRALGVNVEARIILGLALSNGLIALAGS